MLAGFLCLDIHASGPLGGGCDVGGTQNQITQITQIVQIVCGFGMLLGPEETPAVGWGFLGVAVPGPDRLTHSCGRLLWAWWVWWWLWWVGVWWCVECCIVDASILLCLVCGLFCGEVL